MNQQHRKLMVKFGWALIFLLVIAGGVYLGIYGAVKTGFAEQFALGEPPAEIGNVTSFMVGNTFPDFIITDNNNDSLSLSALIKGEKAVVAFVENGCDPCHQLIEYFETVSFSFEGRQLLLLSMEPSFLETETGARYYQIDQQLPTQLEINATPTIVGIDAAGKITFVVCGFGAAFDEDYIEKYL